MVCAHSKPDSCYCSVRCKFWNSASTFHAGCILQGLLSCNNPDGMAMVCSNCFCHTCLLRGVYLCDWTSQQHNDSSKKIGRLDIRSFFYYNRIYFFKCVQPYGKYWCMGRFVEKNKSWWRASWDCA